MIIADPRVKDDVGQVRDEVVLNLDANTFVRAAE